MSTWWLGGLEVKSTGHQTEYVSSSGDQSGGNSDLPTEKKLMAGFFVKFTLDIHHPHRMNPFHFGRSMSVPNP